MHVVLFEPQIPQNTGNIARLCAGTRVDLHLVGKLGFSLSDKYLKRAGLDYWPHVKLHLHDTLEDALKGARPENIAFYSTHATASYDAFDPPGDPYFVFGRETSGLPDSLHENEKHTFYTIPITEHIRSLNLANSVAIVIYEGLRRRGFDFGQLD
jgi:tRNA (cytidine/uridine-2'-O-)-methyltransferase